VQYLLDGKECMNKVSGKRIKHDPYMWCNLQELDKMNIWVPARFIMEDLNSKMWEVVA
jgi:hypothetical protein